MRHTRLQKTPTGSLRFYHFIGTGFYSGRLPGPSGTWGSLVALILASALFSAYPNTATPTVVSFIAVLVTLFAVYCSEKLLRGGIYGHNSDPGEIVIDEFAGMFVSMIGCYGAWRCLVLSFILFRIFDITKPFPARRCEEFPGGIGLVSDDIVAGFYALMFTHFVKTLLF